MSIRLLVADDHQVIHAGLARLLAGTDIEIVAEAAGGNECIQKAEETAPDVILMDIRMADGDGLSALKELREKVPDVAVVIMSAHDNPTYVARAVVMGASDYILKGASRDEIVSTINAASHGESPGHHGQLRRIAGILKMNQAFNEDDVPLTKREAQVLRHVAFGLSNKEIARSLGISVETVKEHMQNLLRKTAANDRTQAAVWAVRKGLV